MTGVTTHVDRASNERCGLACLGPEDFAGASERFRGADDTARDRRGRRAMTSGQPA
jgi:hypothetical protein